MLRSGRGALLLRMGLSTFGACTNFFALSHRVFLCRGRVRTCALHVCVDVAVAGLLAVAGLQAAGGPQGAGGTRGRTAEEAAAGEGDPRQAAHLRSLHQLIQVRTPS